MRRCAVGKTYTDCREVFHWLGKRAVLYTWDSYGLNLAIFLTYFTHFCLNLEVWSKNDRFCLCLRHRIFECLTKASAKFCLPQFCWNVGNRFVAEITPPPPSLLAKQVSAQSRVGLCKFAVQRSITLMSCLCVSAYVNICRNRRGWTCAICWILCAPQAHLMYHISCWSIEPKMF